MAKYHEQLPGVLSFFKNNPSAKAKMLATLSQENGLSLRLLDWFVTYFSKVRGVFVSSEDGKLMCVHAEYKNNLRAYSKRGFDPFCRRERIVLDNNFDLTSGEGMCTTIGQLCFFRWAVESGIIDHCCTNVRDLEIALAEWSVSKSKVNRVIDRCPGYYTSIGSRVNF